MKQENPRKKENQNENQKQEKEKENNINNICDRYIFNILRE